MSIPSDSPRFSWIHLSDFQFRERARGGYEEARDALYRDLESLHTDLGPWHAVLISGDVAFAGRRSEFDRAENEIGELLDMLKSLGAAPRVFVVPGNHDLDRSIVTPGQTGQLRYLSETISPAQSFSDSSILLEDILKPPFSEYIDWLSRSAFVEKMDPGEIPGDFAAVADGAGCRVGVIGLNTTFMQLDQGDYFGQLALSPGQLEKLTGPEPEKWFADLDGALLLTHHGPAWLSPAARVLLHTSIAPMGRFAAHLCGSGLKRFDTEVYSPIPGQTVIQARSFRQKGERGYVLGSLSFSDTGSELHVWPRAYDEKKEIFNPDLGYMYDLGEGDHLRIRLPEREQRKKFVPTKGDPDTAPEPPVLLEQIELINFRCFERIRVPLNRPSGLSGHWTCIVGINGAGKSSIVEAICLAMTGYPIIRELGGERLGRMQRRSGTRVLDSRLRLWLRELGEPRYLELNLESSGLDPSTGSREQPTVTLQLWERLRGRVFTAYGATRNLAAYLETRNEHLSIDLRRLMTVFDPLTQLTSASLLIESRRGNSAVKRLLSNLAAQVFESELKPVLRGNDDLLQFSVDDKLLETLDLPDGFRSSIAWMADLCATWFEKNPSLAREGNPADIEGIVILDEIALHLHPALQREIVPRLRQALPKVQFIVSTHSPLVLSSFDSREIVALDRSEPDGIRRLDRQILGFSTDEIYRWLMGTPSTSAAMEEVLSRQEEMTMEEKIRVAEIIRQSPETTGEEAQQKMQDFRSRLDKLKK